MTATIVSPIYKYVQRKLKLSSRVINSVYVCMFSWKQVVLVKKVYVSIGVEIIYTLTIQSKFKKKIVAEKIWGAMHVPELIVEIKAEDRL